MSLIIPEGFTEIGSAILKIISFSQQDFHTPWKTLTGAFGSDHYKNSQHYRVCKLCLLPSLRRTWWSRTDRRSLIFKYAAAAAAAELVPLSASSAAAMHVI